MKRGAHMLAPGPEGVKGRFVREIMLLLDGISFGGTNQKREKGFTPVMSVTKLSSLCKFLASTVAMCLPSFRKKIGHDPASLREGCRKVTSKGFLTS